MGQSRSYGRCERPTKMKMSIPTGHQRVELLTKNIVIHPDRNFHYPTHAISTGARFTEAGRGRACSAGTHYELVGEFQRTTFECRG